MDEDHLNLAKRLFPTFFDEDEGGLEQRVLKLASTFFTRETFAIDDPILLHNRRKDLRVTRNWFRQGALSAGEIGLVMLDELSVRLGSNLTVYLQCAFGISGWWAHSEASVDVLIEYFNGIQFTDDLYIVAEDWSVCLVITHDDEVKLAEPLPWATT